VLTKNDARKEEWGNYEVEWSAKLLKKK
jgi:hypothetical protein